MSEQLQNVLEIDQKIDAALAETIGQYQSDFLQAETYMPPSVPLQFELNPGEKTVLGILISQVKADSRKTLITLKNGGESEQQPLLKDLSETGVVLALAAIVQDRDQKQHGFMASRPLCQASVNMVRGLYQIAEVDFDQEPFRLSSEKKGQAITQHVYNKLVRYIQREGATIPHLVDTWL